MEDPEDNLEDPDASDGSFHMPHRAVVSHHSFNRLVRREFDCCLRLLRIGTENIVAERTSSSGSITNYLITTLASAGVVSAKWKANSKSVVGRLTAQDFDSPSLNLAGGDRLKVLARTLSPPG